MPARRARGRSPRACRRRPARRSRGARGPFRRPDPGPPERPIRRLEPPRKGIRVPFCARVDFAVGHRRREPARDYPWTPVTRRTFGCSLVLVALVVVAAPSGRGGASADPGTWPVSAGDLSGTRAARASRVDSGNVLSLAVRWRFRLAARPTSSGIFASTPVVDGRTVYVQDLRSNVYALARETGALRWKHLYGALNEGPNGLAVQGARVFGATDSDAFALSAVTGRQLWRRHLTSATEQFVDIAPVPWHGLVFLSTVGYVPGGRGAIYALSARTGAVRWKFDTIAQPWRHPMEAGGGGLWYPVSVDARGRLYAGNSNPTPWGGTPKRPNGAAFPGRALYTDSLIVLDARTGRLLWADQVTRHDIRDYDFQATPVLANVGGRALVFGAGKAGR